MLKLMEDSDWENLRYFNASEFTHPHLMSYSLLQRLDSARSVAGVPFHVTSDYRDDDSPTHSTGQAVDILAPDSATRYRIVAGAIRSGFLRIGVYTRHVHLDTAVFPHVGSRFLWIGESR